MGKGEEKASEGIGTGGTSTGGRRVVYCLIPYDLADKLHEPLRRHFRDAPGVEVIIEQRARERRRSGERRSAGAGAQGPSAPATERRRIRSEAGRRVAERRAALLQAEAPPLPRRAARHADRITFVERLEPSTQEAEDRDTARLVTCFQAGDKDAFAALYLRYFERVYSYLRVVLRHRDEAEDAAQQVFVQVFEAMPRYERRSAPFRAWLFVAARNYAMQHLRKHGRVESWDRNDIDSSLRNGETADEAVVLPRWLTDPDLLILVERLPLAQRQALTLRYALGFSNAEIAQILDRTPESVRMLQSRAIAFLRKRLAALGRQPRHERRARMWRWPRQARVLRARRFSLTAPGPIR